MTRIAIVDKVKCKNGVNCAFICGGACPVNRSGNECIIEGDDNKPVIDEGLCVGCGICPKKCPFEAIQIINLPEELESPIHRFGENGFALYSLPTPRFGRVVGVLGKNGIGKSTAIKILAGVTKPNFGTEIEADFSEIIEHFKGTEAQRYFERQRDGKITVAYKPQNVDLIQKKARGRVRTLLKKVDERGMLDRITGELDISAILDNDISKISGGELQRVAIAATVLKKANLYIFDEPTSYLDIKQRIKVSKFIKGLAADDVAVMVVEHDLIILDYMTDTIHLMYGKEGAFGIVSLPKVTRVGINIYLHGYLKEENIRFRDKGIAFLSKPPVKGRRKVPMTSWQDVTKKLGSFTLQAHKGEINQHEVVGILGENGIGKTSFVKILAGADKQDSGDISETVSVSYKPQYLGTSQKLVATVLKDAPDALLIRPLNLKPLMEKRISELSGGELQRVAIAVCLARDAKLYLLDEPSAYLDVEQRLIVSKVIRDVMDIKGSSALVVEHDLLFVDYLSHALIVFDGVPAKRGEVHGPFTMEEGMNRFLQDLDITLRRDLESKRPRINKPGSQMDSSQKKEGKLYYV
ncbi:MAG: ribosome biogenesis/translation initiation ATPase RLI [archaeon]